MLVLINKRHFESKVSRDIKWESIFMEINNYIKTDFLKHFKIYYPRSLFEPDFNYLKEFRCPICLHKLYWNRDKTIARCKSIKRDKFFIKKETLLKFGII